MGSNVDKSKISENAVGIVPPITLFDGSKEIAFLDPKKYRVVSNISSPYNSSVFLGDTDYSDPVVPPADPKENAVPQLEDITVFKTETYLVNGVTKARLTIRVQNSSGKELLGVDYRRSI